VPDGPPDLDSLVDRPAHAAGVPAEHGQAVLDELAVHEAQGRLLRQLLTASLESRHNGMQATDSVLTGEEAAAALSVTVSYLRHDADRLYVEMPAAMTEGLSCPVSEKTAADLPTNRRRSGIAFHLCSIEDVVALNAVHAQLFQGAPAAGRS
jgi:hypothetical protein